MKRKPRPTANAPPIDVFPTYDEQPGPSTDDYTCPPLEDHRSGLVRLWRITLQRLIIKTTLGQPGFLCPKSQHFSPFIGKCLLDHTTGIRYMNPGLRLPDDDCRFFLIQLYIGMHSVTAHNFKFSPDSIQKREFLLSYDDFFGVDFFVPKPPL